MAPMPLPEGRAHAPAHTRASRTEELLLYRWQAEGAA